MAPRQRTAGINRTHAATGTLAHPSPKDEAPACFHCGTLCRGSLLRAAEKPFCCQGCLTVFELLTQNGLTEFYQLAETAGVRVTSNGREEQFRYLDDPIVAQKLVDYTDSRLTRVTFHLPAIHCIACVWLLENLFRLKAGIGQSQVNFPRKEIAISFQTAQVKLSEVVALLASLGYEPELKLADLDARPASRIPKRLWLQLGFAGFAFGNTMLFSLAGYFGLDAFSGPTFKRLVGLISLALSLPVVMFSAADYWRSAWVSLRQRLLNIDVPIAAGIAALFLQSTYEVLSGHGEGYFDSLAGLLFFLLCGRLFQQKTYDRLAFDRDYRSFFPLSVTRKRHGQEERIALAQIALGERLTLRNGELIPADARLIEGPAVIDYSFVTGESEPVEKRPGDHLYAGGRQIGGTIEVETVKAVSQSYLTSLWNQDAFRKEEGESFQTLTNRYSQRFTKLVIAVALGASLYWAFVNPALSLKAFTSVLIVACPCALALAAPFALGTSQRLLARRDVFLKNAGVVETLARVNSVVFDKTGTLTASGAGSVTFQGEPLSETEKHWLYSVARHSTHPHSVRIAESLGDGHSPEAVRSFVETAGCGIEGSVSGHEVWMGSASWLASRGIREPESFDGLQPDFTNAPAKSGQGSAVHVVIDGTYRGCYRLVSALRKQAQDAVRRMAPDCELALLSGDNDKDRARFEKLFGHGAALHFHQSPQQKLSFVQSRQHAGRVVMMVGDGLNDAGALKQSDVGAAVVENISAFSPASDLIIAGAMVPQMGAVLRFARQTVRVVQASFQVSALYNVIGIAIAAQGRLSPVVCAILMPLSSATVVAFASGLTTWMAHRTFGREGQPSSQDQSSPSVST